jgi:hypothetical protein
MRMIEERVPVKTAHGQTVMLLSPEAIVQRAGQRAQRSGDAAPSQWVRRDPWVRLTRGVPARAKTKTARKPKAARRKAKRGSRPK